MQLVAKKRKISPSHIREKCEASKKFTFFIYKVGGGERKDPMFWKSKLKDLFGKQFGKTYIVSLKNLYSLISNSIAKEIF